MEKQKCPVCIKREDIPLPMGWGEILRIWGLWLVSIFFMAVLMYLYWLGNQWKGPEDPVQNAAVVFVGCLTVIGLAVLIALPGMPAIKRSLEWFCRNLVAREFRLGYVNGDDHCHHKNILIQGLKDGFIRVRLGGLRGVRCEYVVLGTATSPKQVTKLKWLGKWRVRIQLDSGDVVETEIGDHALWLLYNSPSAKIATLVNEHHSYGTMLDKFSRTKGLLAPIKGTKSGHRHCQHAKQAYAVLTEQVAESEQSTDSEAKPWLSSAMLDM